MNIKYILAPVIVAILILNHSAKAQYIDSSGSNAFITQYVEESAENWDKSILFVFYDGNNFCQICPKAIEMIYKIYAENFSSKMNIFEIDYSQPDEFDMRIDYNLSQPLSLVVVRINDGMSRGFYKIDNPQQWIDNPFYFKNQIITYINNFLLS